LPDYNVILTARKVQVQEKVRANICNIEVQSSWLVEVRRRYISVVDRLLARLIGQTFSKTRIWTCSRNQYFTAETQLSFKPTSFFRKDCFKKL